MTRFVLPFNSIFDGNHNAFPAILTFVTNLYDTHTEWDVEYTENGQTEHTFIWTVIGHIYVVEEQRL